MPVKEIKHLVPAVDCLLGAVIRTIPSKKCVAGAIVAMKLVVLAVLLQFRLGLVHMFGRRIGVFIPKQTQ
jgi:hypothetical protein